MNLDELKNGRTVILTNVPPELREKAKKLLKSKMTVDAARDAINKLVLEGAKKKMQKVDGIMESIFKGTPESADKVILTALNIDSVEEVGPNKLPSWLPCIDDVEDARSNSPLRRCLERNAIPTHMFYEDKEHIQLSYRKLMWIVAQKLKLESTKDKK